MPVQSQPTQGTTSITELPVQAAGAATLPLKGNHPFRYWLDLNGIDFAEGEPVFLPIKVSVRPGVQGVPGNGAPAVADAYQTDKLRRVMVPLDFEVTAWGKTRTGYLDKTLAFTDSNGKEVHHWHDCWTRYRMVGTRMVTTFDTAGWNDFRKRVAKLAPGGAPDPEIAETARDAEVQRAHVIRATTPNNPRATAVAEQIEAKVKPKPKGKAKADAT